MLNILFFLLLLANGVLFAFHQGYLDGTGPGGHEPERMKNQLNADKIRLVTAPVAAPAAPASTPDAAPHTASADNAVAAAAAPAAAATPLCVEIGSFTQAEARRFEAQLASLPSAAKSNRMDVTEPSSHMVLIPSQGDKVGADKKVAELRALGVTDYYVLQDNPDPALRWGISLGIFKSEEAARAYLAQLSQKGVRSARLVEYKTPMKKVAFQIRGDAQLRTDIDKLKSAFPAQQMRDCPATDPGR